MVAATARGPGCNMHNDETNLTALARAILEMDAHLPHTRPISDDAPRPAWCHVFCKSLNSPAGECCGICVELSEITRDALDKNFKEAEG